MRQHDDRRIARLSSLLCQERSPERRVHPQHLEKVATDPLHPDGSVGARAGEQLLAIIDVGSQPLEDLILVSVVQILGV